MSEPIPYYGIERRHDEIAALRDHVDARLAAQDAKLDELLAILRAGKVVGTAIKWCAAIAASFGALWSLWRGHR